MFPHTITIYRHSVENGEDVYKIQHLDGFYWQQKCVRNAENKGVAYAAEVSAVSSAERAHTYGKSWNVQVGDKIIKGNGNNISSLNELNNYYSVYAVEENICGSDVDNIVISGK